MNHLTKDTLITNYINIHVFLEGKSVVKEAVEINEQILYLMQDLGIDLVRTKEVINVYFRLRFGLVNLINT